MSSYQDLNTILTQILLEITHFFKKIICVDRVNIFLVDRDDHEQCLILSSQDKHFIEVRVPIHTGIGGLANLKKFAKLPLEQQKYAIYASSSHTAHPPYYTTYNLRSLPLFNQQGTLIAFIQLINKLNPKADPELPLPQKIDPQGFTKKDKKRFAHASTSIQTKAERCQSLYAEIKKQRAIVSFIKAIHGISQGGLDLDTTLKLIVDEAQELMNADRTTLWLIDREQGELWTNKQISDRSTQQIRLPIGVGFVGKVAASGKPINIPFDLYIHPGSAQIKQLDRQHDYRTCSLLCLPVFNPDGELVGVMELVNKKKEGNFPDYHPDDWPLPPERFKASFSQGNLQLMAAFNLQVGIVLQNVQLFTNIKQQEQIQRQIFSTLENGVIYTDAKGEIITLNEGAKRLLKIPESEQFKGRSIRDIVQIKEAKFCHWFQDALAGHHQQYHPNQTLIAGAEERQIHLSINAIADTNNTNNIEGILVILRDTGKEESINYSTSHQISQELTQTWLKERNSKSVIPEDGTILSVDLRGYANWDEELKSEQIIDWINHYFEAMVESVMKYQGTLNKYMGDTLIAVFGSSLPLQAQVWYAVQAALEMRQRLAEFNQYFPNQDQQSLQMGIGIHSGKMNYSHNGLSLSCPSDAINFTCLLERTTQQYNCDIIISETTYQHCRDRVWVRQLDRLQLKPKKPPLTIYQLVGLRSQPISPQQEQILAHAQKGHQYYLQREFALALTEFSQILAIDSSDMAAILQVQRCLHWLKSPPPPNWDGVWKATEI